MTDTPGREPEQRLPAPRPPSETEPVETAPVERFSSTPSTRSVELSPERAAQVVRQSSNARWVGFLAVVIVMLFVAIYWFYELGAPLGMSESRLDAEAADQSIVNVERGYNVYQANCARCHGANGEGGIGPVLNSQDKLYQHLNANYLNTVLTAGGRYVCGNPQSLMPVWSNTATPARPAQLPPDPGGHLVHPRDERGDLHDPRPRARDTRGRPDHRRGQDVPGLGRHQLHAASGQHARTPRAGPTSSRRPPRRRRPGPRALVPQPSASVPAGATTLPLTAQGIKFDTDALTVPANQAFSIDFDNQDVGVPHDVSIKDGTGSIVYKGETFPGIAKKTYDVSPLAAGAYTFFCTRARQHDRDPDRTVIDRRPRSVGWVRMGGRWRNRRSQPGPRCRDDGPCSACSTPTAGVGRPSRPSSGWCSSSSSSATSRTAPTTSPSRARSTSASWSGRRSTSARRPTARSRARRRSARSSRGSHRRPS